MSKTIQLKKRIEELESQYKSYNKDLYTQADFDNYLFNKKLDLKILRTKFELNLIMPSSNQPIQKLKDRLSAPCTLIDDAIHVDINDGILNVTEGISNGHKFLLFFSESTDLFYDDERYPLIVEEIVRYQIEKAKEDGLKSLILQYENLNNCDVELNLEGLGFRSHHQDRENFGASFLFVNEPPELFRDHLPRGFYIHEMEKDQQVENLVKILEVLQNIEGIESRFYHLNHGITIKKNDMEFCLSIVLSNNTLYMELQKYEKHDWVVLAKGELSLHSNTYATEEMFKRLFSHI